MPGGPGGRLPRHGRPDLPPAGLRRGDGRPAGRNRTDAAPAAASRLPSGHPPPAGDDGLAGDRTGRGRGATGVRAVAGRRGGPRAGRERRTRPAAGPRGRDRDRGHRAHRAVPGLGPARRDHRRRGAGTAQGARGRGRAPRAGGRVRPAAAARRRRAGRGGGTRAGRAGGQRGGTRGGPGRGAGPVHREDARGRGVREAAGPPPRPRADRPRRDRMPWRRAGTAGHDHPAHPGLASGPGECARGGGRRRARELRVLPGPGAIPAARLRGRPAAGTPRLGRVARRRPGDLRAGGVRGG